MAGRQFSRLIPLCRNIPKHRISFLATRCLHQRSMLSGAKSQLLLITSNKQIKPYSSAAALEYINIQDESDFEKRVLDSPKPVVVDFHATSVQCQPLLVSAMGRQWTSLLAYSLMT
ncbi:Hypothetical predicted protein [Octopus vulgaris]|uniref:Thioredoxin, mitochondrial-like n=2 Tax=Octopus vulgaris TaxID=6645 RepID=A0AA36AUA9_OCTVU|nr:Hypothetical predicted protein [Octopus vulgaris]